MQNPLNWAEHIPSSQVSGTGAWVATSPRICGAAKAGPETATAVARAAIMRVGLMRNRKIRFVMT